MNAESESDSRAPEPRIIVLRGANKPLPWNTLAGASLVTIEASSVCRLLFLDPDSRLPPSPALILDCTAIDAPEAQLSSILPFPEAIATRVVSTPRPPNPLKTLVGAHDSICWYHPFAMEPAFLECRRVVSERRVGLPERLELVVTVPAQFRAQNEPGLFMIPQLFFGPDAGGRIERDGAGLRFRIGALDGTIRIVRAAAGQSWRIAGTVACSEGQVEIDSGRALLVVSPERSQPYRLPLPEGDGTYYFMRETLRLTGGDLSVFVSDSIVRNAWNASRDSNAEDG